MDSAPNYCGAYKNKGSCLKIENNSLNIRQFVWTQHPYYLPNFMDVFTWSLPFVAEKVTNMLSTILAQVTQAQQADNETVAVQGKHVGLRQKVLAVSKVMKFYNTLRKEQEDIIKLKQLSPNQKIPNGVLAGGKEAIQEALEQFKHTKKADAASEAYPNLTGQMMHRNSTMFSLITEKDQETYLKDFETQISQEEPPEELNLENTPSIAIEEHDGVQNDDIQKALSAGGLVGASRTITSQKDILSSNIG